MSQRSKNAQQPRNQDLLFVTLPDTNRPVSDLSPDYSSMGAFLHTSLPLNKKALIEPCPAIKIQMLMILPRVPFEYSLSICIQLNLSRCLIWPIFSQTCTDILLTGDHFTM